jgi:hypothetical protein
MRNKLKEIRRQPLGGAALIVAVLALCAAMVGTSLAVTKIKNGTITGKKLKNGAVTKKKIADGAVGATKLGTITTRTKTLGPVANNQSGVDTVTCNSNEVVLSGGAAYQAVDPNADVTIRSSFKDLANNGWRVAVRNNSGAPASYTIEAYCLAK